MARFSTHVLNGLDGTHASDVGVRFTCIKPDGLRVVLFDAVTDPGGRLSRDIDPSQIEGGILYELTFLTGKYWSSLPLGTGVHPVTDEVIVRLKIKDVNDSLHVPLILSPYSHSIWVSLPEARNQ